MSFHFRRKRIDEEVDAPSGALRAIVLLGAPSFVLEALLLVWLLRRS